MASRPPSAAADTAAWRETIPATADPFALFDAWLAEARESEVNDPEAMALATAAPDAAPSLRMVLLKEHGAQVGRAGGFVFYTNAHSRKGGEIAANPQASALFHWKSLRRQIRVEGVLSQVSPAMADAYFASRARDSQLGAIASDQSAPMAARAEFHDRYAAVAARYDGRPADRPSHWTGFILAPDAIEFWVDRAYRLHERRRFTRDGKGGWASTLLYP